MLRMEPPRSLRSLPPEGAAGALGAARRAPGWIDTHCHLDAAEFDADRDAVVARARAAGVSQIVIPTVDVHNLDTVRLLAIEHRFAYALGIHPLCVMRAGKGDLGMLAEALETHGADPRLVAVGEI